MEIGKKFPKLTWRKRDLQLHVNEVAFRGDSSLPAEVLALETPLQIFKHFFDDELVDHIVNSTNAAATQADPATQFSVKRHEIYNFIGICIYMSVFPNPNVW